MPKKIKKFWSDVDFCYMEYEIWIVENGQGINTYYYFWVLSHTKLINKGSSVFKQYYPKLYFKNRVITIF